jgi:hypothetical protein
MRTERRDWSQELLEIRRNGVRPAGGAVLSTMRSYLNRMAQKGFFVGLIRDDDQYELAGLAALAIIVATPTPNAEWIQQLCVQISAVGPHCLMLGDPAKANWQWPVPHPADRKAHAA